MQVLTLGAGRYDRTQPLLDGRVTSQKFDIRPSSPPLEELFARSFDHQEFTISELSLSNFMLLTAAGQCAYAALPIFPSRMFRHSAIYIRNDRGIEKPANLAGRTVGIREYSNTATLTVKGLLADEYGVKPSDIRWRYGAVDSDDEHPKTRALPEGIDIAPISPNTNLSDLLVSAELDAIISYRPPACFVEGTAPVRRLFADHHKAEAAYFRKTGIFPIMHVVGMHKSLLGRGIGEEICNLFERSKRIALAAVDSYQALAVSLPWAPVEAARTREVLGSDPWPYGIKANEAALRAALRWAWEQGLVTRQLDIAELFATETLSWEPASVSSA
jgi:4,5-dihydroxyphthalate decarboxylase